MDSRRVVQGQGPGRSAEDTVLQALFCAGAWLEVNRGRVLLRPTADAGESRADVKPMSSLRPD
jgi:hypothetical protein